MTVPLSPSGKHRRQDLLHIVAQVNGYRKAGQGGNSPACRQQKKRSLSTHLTTQIGMYHRFTRFLRLITPASREAINAPNVEISSSL